jgi:hypothetical protein
MAIKEALLIALTIAIIMALGAGILFIIEIYFNLI